MGKAVKGKKTAQKTQVAVENGQEIKTLPKSPENDEIKDNIQDIPLNGDTKAKPSSKSSKSAKDKKESNAEIQITEPKTTKGTKKAKEVVLNNEQEVPAEKDTKTKRAVKKKLEEKPENETGTKRSKKEPVNDSKKEGENVENGNKPEAKKRGRKEVSKTVPEQLQADDIEKKRLKKDDKAAAKIDEKKTRGKKTADVPKVVEKVVEEIKPKGKVTKKTDKPAVVPVETKKPSPKKTKGKAAKKVEVAEENNAESANSEKPPAKETKGKAVKKAASQKNETASPKKAKGKAASKDELDAKIEAEEQPKKGRGAKKFEETAGPSTEVKEKSTIEAKQLQNSIQSDFDIDFDISSSFNLKIVTWNISGLRSCVDKGCVEYFTHENPDIICLNEIKCGTEQDIPEKIKLEGYHAYWNIAKGQPGVGILSKQMPMEVFYDLPGEFSEEKRLVTAEFKKFYLVCCYVVNAGRGLKTLDKRLEWNKAFDDYIKELDRKKPVIIAGDLNVAHNEIDLANPKGNQKNAGFTKQEREGFSQLLSYGFVDTFRSFYPDKKGSYTFWSYMANARAKNIGWRLDYFVASERFMDKVKDNAIRSTIKGSDHCPIVLFLDL